MINIKSCLKAMFKSLEGTEEASQYSEISLLKKKPTEMETQARKISLMKVTKYTVLRLFNTEGI